MQIDFFQRLQRIIEKYNKESKDPAIKVPTQKRYKIVLRTLDGEKVKEIAWNVSKWEGLALLSRLERSRLVKISDAQYELEVMNIEEDN